jgi:ankyrin repeat protein
MAIKNESSQEYLTAALFQAVENNDENAVKELLSLGANPNGLETYKNMSRPMHYAISNKCKRTIRVLLAAGADIHLKDMEGRSPLDDAFEIDDDEILSLLNLPKSVEGK